MITFFVPCIPPKTTAQQLKVMKFGNRTIIAKGDTAMQAENDLLSLLKGHREASPLTGPLSLTIEATWPWRKGDSKKVREQGRAPMTTKPDADNFAKMVMDSLVKLAYLESDQLVCELTIRKFWGDEPGIRVALTPIEVKA